MSEDEDEDAPEEAFKDVLDDFFQGETELGDDEINEILADSVDFVHGEDPFARVAAADTDYGVLAADGFLSEADLQKLWPART